MRLCEVVWSADCNIHQWSLSTVLLCIWQLAAVEWQTDSWLNNDRACERDDRPSTLKIMLT